MQGFKKIYFSLFNSRNAKANVADLAAHADVHVIFPFYHIVSNENVQHVKHLYPVKSIAAFTQDLEFLLQHFKPLHIDDYCSGNFNKSEKYFVLSFDDGLREMAEVVKPILLAKGIPALFFLNSDFIDNKALFFRYKVSLLIDSVPQKELSQNIATHLPLQKVKIANPATYLLQLTWNDTALIDAIAVTSNVNFTNYLNIQKPYLSSLQISDLINSGFAIGAHSVSHPLYSSIDPQIQFIQTRDSMKIIAEQFQLKHKYFAFPFTADGVVKELFNAMYNELHIDLSFGTAGLKKQSRMQHIERIPAELNDMTFEQILKNELGYFQLKKVFGR